MLIFGLGLLMLPLPLMALLLPPPGLLLPVPPELPLLLTTPPFVCNTLRCTRSEPFMRNVFEQR